MITAREMAKLLKLTKQRVLIKIQQGHFPGHRKCECGMSFMLPVPETIEKHIKKRKKKGA